MKKDNFFTSTLKAFNGDAERRKAFLNTCANFKKGRHILDICPSFVYELKNGQNARRRALNALFMSKSDNLGFMNMSPKSIYILSDLAYDAIYEGLITTLSLIDINGYISADKIVKAGGAIKNHNADDTFGGRTVRDYITYMVKTNTDVASVTPEELMICKKIIKQKESELTYTNVKSLPFAILNYNDKIQVVNGELKTPDIEAKCNLKKILGDELYKKCNISKITITDATICEDLLIKKIKKLVSEEISLIYHENENKLSDKLKEKLIRAGKISNLVRVTNHGQIKDIVENYKNNICNLVSLATTPDVIMKSEEVNSIFQIEYAAMQEDINSPVEYMLWLTDFGAAKNGRFTTYSKLIPIIENHCSPCIDGSPITDYEFTDTSKINYLLTQYVNANNEQKEKIVDVLKSLIKEDK